MPVISPFPGAIPRLSSSSSPPQRDLGPRPSRYRPYAAADKPPTETSPFMALLRDKPETVSAIYTVLAGDSPSSQYGAAADLMTMFPDGNGGLDWDMMMAALRAKAAQRTMAPGMVAPIGGGGGIDYQGVLGSLGPGPVGLGPAGPPPTTKKKGR